MATGLGRYTTGLQIYNVNIKNNIKHNLTQNRCLNNYMNIRYGCIESARIAIMKRLKKRKVINLKNLKIQRSMVTKSTRKSTRKYKKSRKQKTLLIKSNLNYPKTRKSLGVRMGKGGAMIDEWIQPIKPHTVFFEISRAKVKLRKSYRLLKAASIKLPAKSRGRFLYSRTYMRREMNFSINKSRNYNLLHKNIIINS
jgi:ribosomal protein L16/L10AE